MLCLLVQMKKVADEFDICFFVCIWTFLADDVHRFIGVLCSTQVLDEALLVLVTFHDDVPGWKYRFVCQVVVSWSSTLCPSPTFKRFDGVLLVAVEYYILGIRTSE